MENTFYFLEEEYNSKEKLALALHGNFGDAINYIFSDSFIDSIKDPYLKGRILVCIRSVKYAESALTLVIYLLDPQIGLSIRGKAFSSLNDLANYMTENDVLKKTLEHLLLDHVLTLTLAQDLSQEEKDKLFEIESNIENTSVYYLFEHIYALHPENTDHHGLSKYDYYFYDVKASKDPFLTYYNVLTSPIFKADLMQTIGIENTMNLYKSQNMPFVVLKELIPVLKLDVTILLNTGIHFWVAENLKQYKTKGLASDVAGEIKKTYSKLKKPNIKDVKYKLTEDLYAYYNLFVKLVDLGLVEAKNPKYALNKQNSLRECEAYNQLTNYKGQVEEVKTLELSKQELKERLAALTSEFKEIKKN